MKVMYGRRMADKHELTIKMVTCAYANSKILSSHEKAKYKKNLHKIQFKRQIFLIKFPQKITFYVAHECWHSIPSSLRYPPAAIRI